MDYTRSFKTETKKEKLDIQERAMADLMNSGWKEQDAYVMCFGSGPAYSDDWHKKRIRSIVDREVFAKYCSKASAKKDAAIDEELKNDEDVKLMSKEEVMTELLVIAKRMSPTDPRRADIMMKYADLNQMKKETTESDDRTVHTYLPLTCKNCPLYIKAKENRTS